MTTATQLIDEALKILRVKAPDMDTPASEYADGLIRLNDMLANWAMDINALGHTTRLYGAVTGSNPMTIGPSGNITATTRPIKISGLCWGLTDTDRRPLDMLSWGKLNELSSRYISDTHTPVTAAFRVNGANTTNAELWLMPIPVYGRVQFLAFCPLYSWTALSTDVTLPTGLKRAIELNLAIELAGQYQISASEETTRLAEQALVNWVKQVEPL